MNNPQKGVGGNAQAADMIKGQGSKFQPESGQLGGVFVGQRVGGRPGQWAARRFGK
ncbi:hypothetical protein MGYG_06005 [Nannizzia gypsea CBS 118893]|uniref:Uncharacterized protein n=1 Tax=Arthroderma gypseum (strain ATCC MYA-4604 / CBS 118893) TaxID=535722 RepID=E4V067_ARTGP|nr:hypothetical protein MGYG_06005 [Nannizzia gypsea CBS 118893]EFR03004.1 hypothetical protein MGYG_06005 [Nannizzia gypsea CBS 118893]